MLSVSFFTKSLGDVDLLVSVTWSQKVPKFCDFHLNILTLIDNNISTITCTCVFGVWLCFTDIVYRVIDGGVFPFRPDTSSLKCDKYIIDCMVDCWSESPEDRPDFRCIYKTLHKMREGM